MPMSMKEVVEKLYRPPSNGGRQVIAVSRATAEKLPRLPGIAVISITAPARSLADVDGFDFLLRLSFDDAEPEQEKIAKKKSKKILKLFSKDNAEDIKSFVESLPAIVKTLIVHCEGGYSRSCGVALALHQRYQFEADLRFLGEANRYVVDVLTRQK